MNKFTSRRVSTGNMFPISEPQLSRRSEELYLPPRPRNPALRRLHKFRTVILPILLVLAFTTLILGAIYAYCVAKPHTDIADQLAVDSTAEADSSIFGKRETTSTTASSSSSSSKAKADEPETALLFYTLTVPGLSMAHVFFELIMHHHTPSHLTLRRTYILFLTTSSLLLAGWLASLPLWMYCELPSLNGGTKNQTACPAQVRGHFMYGIHEVSIARAAVGWLVAVLYATHIALLAMGFKAQRRLWRIQGIDSAGKEQGDGSDTMQHGEARVVVVRFAGPTDGNQAVDKESSV